MHKRADKVTAAVSPPVKHSIHAEGPDRWLSPKYITEATDYTDFLKGPILTNCPQTSNTDKLNHTDQNIDNTR